MLRILIPRQTKTIKARESNELEHPYQRKVWHRWEMHGRVFVLPMHQATLVIRRQHSKALKARQATIAVDRQDGYRRSNLHPALVRAISPHPNHPCLLRRKAKGKSLSCKSFGEVMLLLVAVVVGQSDESILPSILIECKLTAARIEITIHSNRSCPINHHPYLLSACSLVNAFNYNHAPVLSPTHNPHAAYNP